MNKYILIIIGLLLIDCSLFGRYVDTTEAKLVAGNFYLTGISNKLLQNYKSLNPEDLRLKLAFQESDMLSVGSKSALMKTSTPLYYIFDVGFGEGFVIVAADDRIVPVLGFAYTGSYQPEDQPPAFIAWMENYRQQIRYVIEEDLPVNTAILSKWQDLKTGILPKSDAAIDAVSPLISSTWAQGCYYNYLCPEDASGSCGHAKVGCVAVAMAQIIRYWNHPVQNTTIESYTSDLYGTIPAIPPTTYDWANMSNTLSAGSSMAEAQAVAGLLFHCGVSVEMDYGPVVSSAFSSDAANAFSDHFGYSTAADYITRSNYSEAGWVALLRAELDNGRPVFYRGTGDDGGHAFVCDGYLGSDYFHFNWGWGGSYDGYFYLYDLTPGSNYYTDGQSAVINIYPASSGCPDSWESNNSIAEATTNAFASLGTSGYNHTISGTIHDGYDVDVYRIQVSAEGLLAVSLPNPPGDYDLKLTTSGNGLLASSHNSGSEMLTYSFGSAGDYYIYVYSYAHESSCTNYALNVQWIPGSSDQPNLTYNPGYNSLMVSGTNVDISLRVENDGTDGASSSYVGYYLSLNNTITTSDYFIGEDYVLSLSSGSYSSESISVDVATVTPVIPPGTYYIGYIIDYTNVVNESDEGDNRYCFGTQVTIPQPTSEPNLAHDPAYNDLSVSGTNVDISLRIVNNGTDYAPASYVAYYLSANNTITTSDYFIGEDYVYSMSSGNYSSESISVDVSTVTPAIPPGTYYIGYIIDYTNAVDESNENDNPYCFDSPRVTIPQTSTEPNLTYNPANNIISVSGTTVTVGLRVVSDGNATAGASYVAYYLSDNSTITKVDHKIGDDYVESLFSGAYSTESITVDVSEITPAISPGTYYVGYIIDYTDAVDESNEDDNRFCFSSPQVTITQAEYKPNLTFDPAYNSLSVSGTEVDVSLRIENQGTAEASSCHVAYYLSENQSMTSADHFIGQDFVVNLGSGGYSNESISLDVLEVSPSIPPGIYYVGYVIDYLEVVDETSENDNSYCFTNAQVLVPEEESPPNLTYNAGAHELTVEGTVVDVFVRIENTGEGEAPSSRVGYFLSDNISLTGADLLIGEDHVMELASGAYSHESFSIDIAGISPPMPDGTYYLGYIIDYLDEVEETSESDNMYLWKDMPISIPGGPDDLQPGTTLPEISIHPNPATDRLKIESTLPFSSAGLFSAQGIMLKEVVVNQIACELGVGDLKPGIYFIRISHADMHCVVRFIKD